MKALRRRLLLFVEGTSWVLGLAALGSWAAFQIDVARSTRHDLARFAVLQAASLQEEGCGGPVALVLGSHQRLA